MPNGTDNELAQAVYLAQLFAARNTCKCKACRLLRQASDSMMDQMLAGKSKGTALAKAKSANVTQGNIMSTILGEEKEE